MGENRFRLPKHLFLNRFSVCRPALRVVGYGKRICKHLVHEGAGEISYHLKQNLEYQRLFGKGDPALLFSSRGGYTRHERSAEVEPIVRISPGNGLILLSNPHDLMNSLSSYSLPNSEFCLLHRLFSCRSLKCKFKCNPDLTIMRKMLFTVLTMCDVILNQPV